MRFDIPPARLIACALFAVFALGCDSAADDKNNDRVVIDTDSGSDAATTPDSADNLGVPDAGTGCVINGCDEEFLVCNTATGTCVECVTNAECGPNGSCDPVSNKCACDDGFHACDRVCVPDDSVDGCGTSCEICPTVAGATAVCEAGQCAINCPDGLAYDETLMECVTCQQDAECTDADAPRCLNGVCSPCDDASHCAGIADANFCDAGRCVECTAQDESPCGANSCAIDGTCSDTPRGSVASCEPCSADSECMPGDVCVPMQFSAIFRDSAYCLPIDDAGCPQAPYAVAVTRETISAGTTTNVCTINEDLTTCEALADYNSFCGDDSECGDDMLDDGICEPVDFEFARCTSRCSATAECPTTSLIGCATGAVNQMWCGAW